jgi:hypothetical protein
MAAAAILQTVLEYRQIKIWSKGVVMRMTGVIWNQSVVVRHKTVGCKALCQHHKEDQGCSATPYTNLLVANQHPTK